MPLETTVSPVTSRARGHLMLCLRDDKQCRGELARTSTCYFPGCGPGGSRWEQRRSCSEADVSEPTGHLQGLTTLPAPNKLRLGPLPTSHWVPSHPVRRPMPQVQSSISRCSLFLKKKKITLHVLAGHLGPVDRDSPLNAGSPGCKDGHPKTGPAPSHTSIHRILESAQPIISKDGPTSGVGVLQ